MIVQIYSLVSVEDAVAVARLGADHIGVVVGKEGLVADEQTYDQAQAIFAALPPQTVKVALSISTDLEEIIEMAEAVCPDIVQIQVDVDEVPPASMAQLRRSLHPVRLMRAIPVTGEESIAQALRYQDCSDYLLLDTKVPEGAQFGATGQTHDWGVSRRIVESSRIPVILAGGLSPENVAEAIRTVDPWGVDSCTQTNRDDQSFRKDLDKVRRFITAAKGLGPCRAR